MKDRYYLLEMMEFGLSLNSTTIRRFEIFIFDLAQLIVLNLEFFKMTIKGHETVSSWIQRWCIAQNHKINRSYLMTLIFILCEHGYKWKIKLVCVE